MKGRSRLMAVPAVAASVGKQVTGADHGQEGDFQEWKWFLAG